MKADYTIATFKQQQGYIMSMSSLDVLDLLSSDQMFGGISITTGGSMSSGTLGIGNRLYHLNDPHAVTTMSGKERETFWSLCTKEAKNSDHYRQYAQNIMLNARIDLKSVNPAYLREQLLENAGSIHKLNLLFIAAAVSDWFATLSQSPELLKLTASHTNGMFHLLEGLSKVGDRNLLASLNAVPSDYLKMLAEKGSDAGKILTQLAKIRCRNPLATLTDLKDSTLKLALEKQYDFNGLLETLAQVRYPEPFAKIKAINHERLAMMLDKRYDTIELIKALAQLRYSDPVKELSNLDAAEFSMFCEHRYDVIEIINALSSQGNKDPLGYLQALGTKAMIIIFGARYEYVNRIKRGVDLSAEFKPVIKDKLSPALVAFETYLKERPSNQEQVEARVFSKGQLDDFKDSKTGELVNIPVRIDGDLFDLSTLTVLKADSDGLRKNPLSGEKFLLSSIQPAKDVQKKLDQIIAAVPIVELTDAVQCSKN